MRIHYYHVGGLGRVEDDGGAIFDRKTIAALRQLGAAVNDVPVLRHRALRLPTWVGRIAPSELRIPPAEAGSRTILSHEATFDVAREVRADALIVHNYFARFCFPSRKDLELYYRLGSRSYYGRAFDQIAVLFFLSHRERSLAEEDFPEIRGRTIVIPPPPAPLAVSHRNMDVVHISGTEGWLPKRLSRMKDDEKIRFAQAGFHLGDFGPTPSPGFGLITDRFTVGFKLKLMQMIACRDVIASCADIADEIGRVAPGYPYWCHVGSADDALEYFCHIRDRFAVAEIDAAFGDALPHWRIPSWNDHAEAILDAISAI